MPLELLQGGKNLCRCGAPLRGGGRVRATVEDAAGVLVADVDERTCRRCLTEALLALGAEATEVVS